MLITSANKASHRFVGKECRKLELLKKILLTFAYKHKTEKFVWSQMTHWPDLG